MRGEAAGRRPVSELLEAAGTTRHVLLGDPGSGKTTLAQHLCRGHAEDGAPGLLPVRFVLREVAARHLPVDAERGQAGMLWDALAAEVRGAFGEGAAEKLLPHLRARMLEKGAFVVLDGLDEVPEAGRRRAVLLQAVADLAATLGERSHLLVTARPYAYADPRWRLDGFATIALAPFDAAQVDRFVTGWYLHAARRAFGWSEALAGERAERLRTALAARRDLGDLASRPLLLTLMATLHSSWGQLPQDRADLFEETVKLLLVRWQGGAKPGMAERLAHEAGLRGALETLALAAHERQGSEAERDDHPADIRRGEVLLAFEPLLEGVGAGELLAYLEQRAGLLIQRREDTWAFPHRSFQEYLAACRLSQLDEPEKQIQERLRADPAWWREVALLAIARARRHGLGTAMGYLHELLPEAPGEAAEVTDADGHAAVLTGRALLDLRLDPQDAERPQPKALRRRARAWLVHVAEKGLLRPKERVEAGDVLGRLGDERPGVATFEWVEVPAGPFLMGSAADDELGYEDERPQHELHLEGFWISRYPVTNAQFRPFVEAGGYENRDLWTKAGREWLNGSEVDVSIYPEKHREGFKKWLAGRPREKRRQPFFWADEEGRASPSRPVVGITWYEAVAYCRWLSRDAGELGVLPELPAAPERCRFDLPSEAQWEKAARGPEGRIWPWGDDFGEGRCNTSELELRTTSAVGFFPGDQSPCGARELAGNVWEWTLSSWGTDPYKPRFSYPYVAEDGRERLDQEAFIVLRGGSSYDSKAYARCAGLFRGVPAYFGEDCGFRVVLSLANSDF